MKLAEVSALLVAGALAGSGAFGADSPEVTLRDSQGKAEIRVLRATGAVTLKLIRPPRSAGAVELTFRRANGRSTTVALETLSPTRFSGRLPTTEASLLGAEIRIPLTRNRAETVHLMPQE